MKLSEFKNQLAGMQTLGFVLPNGENVPPHFHVTEVGLTTKHFIDCGGVMHKDKYANLQIWVAEDTDHRLEPQKLLRIVEMSEKILAGEDLEMEVEYQSDTIGRYGIAVKNDAFALTAKQTDCLAQVECGVPQAKKKVQLSEIGSAGESCCEPGSKCC